MKTALFNFLYLEIPYPRLAFEKQEKRHLAQNSTADKMDFFWDFAKK